MKKIKDLEHFALSKTSLASLTVKGGECHDTIEYFGGQACKDTYCETLNDCEIECVGTTDC